MADIAAGMYAYSGTRTALYERERTSRGGSVEVAILGALGEWMSQPFHYSVYGGRPAARTGIGHAYISPYRPHPAAGGSQVFLGIQNRRGLPPRRGLSPSRGLPPRRGLPAA